MATCKDCLHVEVCCSYLSIAYNERELTTPNFELLKNINCDKCVHFNDRSRFVELPCKIGDTVYWNILGKPVEDEITNITIYDNCTRVFLKKGISFDIEDIGRMIFLSREQAEQALKERENNENQ